MKLVRLRIRAAAALNHIVTFWQRFLTSFVYHCLSIHRLAQFQKVKALLSIAWSRDSCIIFISADLDQLAFECQVLVYVTTECNI